MRFFVCIFFFVVFAQARVQDFESFPLLGSTWIIGQGQNHRIHPTFGRSIPNSIIRITFPSAHVVKHYADSINSIVDSIDNVSIPNPNEPKVEISWGNFNGRDYRSTTEFLKDAISQLNSMKNLLYVPLSQIYQKEYELKDDALTIARRTLSDTIYACEKDFLNADSRYIRFGMDINGKDFYYNSKSEINVSNSKWQQEYPIAWGVMSEVNRPGIYTQPDPDPRITRKYKTNFSGGGGWIDYCQDGLCYERIPCTQKKIAPVQFWQVHITPKICWYPRDIFTGEPKIVDTLRMTLEQAMAKKKESLDNPDKVDLKYYRNPYFSDSASCYSSISFFDQVLSGQKPLNERDFISVRNITEDTSKKADQPRVDLYIDHIPGRIVRLKQVPYALERAIVTLYSETDDEFYAQDSLYDACFNWKFNDEEIGKLRYPDSLQSKNKPLKKNSTFDEAKYQYFGCPCLGITELNGYTKAQIRRFLFQQPPMCSYKEMCKAMFIYRKAWLHCDNPKDRAQIVNNIILLHASIMDRQHFIKKNKLPQSEVDLINANCSSSWTNSFPDYVTSYTSDLQSSSEKLIAIVKNIKSTFPNKSIEANIPYINTIW